MSIWVYQDTLLDPSKDEVQRDTCLFCKERLVNLDQQSDWNHYAALRACEICGWWSKHRTIVSQGAGGEYFTLYGTCARLKSLDIADISTPIDEVKQYLVAKYEERFNVHPRMFEETVASVFRSFGFSAYVTSYQADGGIDAILEDAKGQMVGVQVKRYRNKIQVEQIRAFAGALILSGYTKGIFVTTSSYSSGALKAIAGYESRGLPIELVDAKRFYDALRLSQREHFKDSSDWLSEVGQVGDQLIYKDEGPTYLFM